MRHLVTFLIIALTAIPHLALAQDVDLILPPALASKDAPFYQEAKVKIGNEVVPVKQGDLPAGTLAQYQPQNKAVIISNTSSASDNDKGQALLDVVAGLQANNITTAAGK